MRYEFAPMPQRKVLKWPHGARIAMLITPNLEYGIVPWTPARCAIPVER